MKSRLFYGIGAIRQLAAFVRKHFPTHRIALITNTRVERLHARLIARMLRGRGFPVTMFTIRPGERAKTRETKARLEDRLLARRCGRNTLIVAVGGGVVGDLAGFVAATYMRGIPYIQIPTTLVAQTDSAIGGKVGVDTSKGKNLIGAFYPPAAVFIDLHFLRTLSRHEIRQGLVEMVKHGLIADPGLARAIVRQASIVTRPRHPRFVRTLLPLLQRGIRIKQRIVARDPFETNGRRSFLNYGHTFGHAIEQASRYRVSHGDAVAIGMTLAARHAVNIGLLQPREAIAQTALLRAIGAPTALPRRLSTDALRRAAGVDKKGHNGQCRLILLRRIGQPVIHPHRGLLPA